MAGTQKECRLADQEVEEDAYDLKDDLRNMGGMMMEVRCE